MTSRTILTAADRALARAQELVPELRARQQETEENNGYGPQVHEWFREAGFYRLLVPQRFGGAEIGALPFYRVAQVIASGCPSTGWMFLFGAAHALPVASLFSERAQEEVFAGGDFLAPATVAPRGEARRTDGGWVIDGTYPYASGAPYATHFVGHVLVQDGDAEPHPMMFVVPREQFELGDDWGNQLGLRGSGSQSVTLHEVEVPDHRTVHAHLGQVTVSEEMAGRRVHRNPLYGGGQAAFMNLELGVVATGILRAALDCYGDLMRDRTTLFPPVVPRHEDPDYQLAFGEVTGILDTAEGALWNAVQTWEELCLGPADEFSRERELRLGLVSREVVGLCRRAFADLILPTAGSASMVHGQMLERLWRDFSMLSGHAGLGVFLSKVATRDIARHRFGGAA